MRFRPQLNMKFSRCGYPLVRSTLDAQLQQELRLRQAVLKRAFEGRLV